MEAAGIGAVASKRTDSVIDASWRFAARRRDHEVIWQPGHELAHIYLGHLGSDEDKWWPSRLNLTRNQREMEAESVAFIVCSRAGLISHSAEYLSAYIKVEQDISRISIDMITKVAGRIENMGQRAMPKRRSKAVKEAS